MFDAYCAEFDNYDIGSPQVLSDLLSAGAKRPTHPPKVDKPGKQPRDPFPKIDDVADRLTDVLTRDCRRVLR